MSLFHCFMPATPLTLWLTWPPFQQALQAFAGIVTVSVGHCHPEVNAAVIEQTQRLQHTTTIYLHNQARCGWQLAVAPLCPCW